jgi:DNA-binding MarR family transcriptional regulator
MSRGKRQLFDELIDEIRRSQNATDRFDQAVADAAGLNRTDMRCLDVLQRAGPLSAGRLAQETGLTSGAMTAVLDRLERRGLARRVRDAGDRRRVLVELSPASLTNVDSYYREHEELSERLYRNYTSAELELLLRFVREGREFNERRAGEVERATRASGGGASDPRSDHGR